MRVHNTRVLLFPFRSTADPQAVGEKQKEPAMDSDRDNKGLTTWRVFYSALVLAILFAMAVPCLVSASEAPSQEIIDAATSGMRAFLTPDRIASLGVLGFHSKEDFNNAALGDALEIFTIPPDRLLPRNRGLCQPIYQEIESLVTSTNRWVFSISVYGKVTNAMVDVVLTDGKPMIEFGSSSFPQLMHDLLAAWPRDSGYRIRYIRIYAANISMVEVSRSGNLVGIVWPSGDLKKVLTPSQVLPSLCGTLKRNMEEDERARDKGEVLLR